MSGFTKGPWKISADGKFVSGADKDCRAFIAHLVVNSDTMFTIGRSEANARLIASAPDLLEALQFYANSEIYKPHPHGPAFDDRDLSFRAREAITKATGAAS